MTVIVNFRWLQYIPKTSKEKLNITDQTSPLEKKSQFDNS